MTVLETDPSDRADLPGFPFQQETVDVEGFSMAYLDEGAGEQTFLCVHGEPTWGYLYRKMVPALAEAGRVVVPDLVGFGASSKPTDEDVHTYEMHARTVTRFVESLDLDEVTLVGQDWGGLLGFHAATRLPDRFARLVAANTFLPDGGQPLPEAWHDFHSFVQRTPDLPAGFLVQRGCFTDLPEDVVAAYDAPFPDEEHKAGPRRLPEMVPRSREHPASDPIRETRKRLQAFEGPTHCVFAGNDPIMKPAAEPMQELMPGSKLEWIDEAGHFIQEDAGEELAERIVDFVESTVP